MALKAYVQNMVDAVDHVIKRAWTAYTKTTGAETLTADQFVDAIVDQSAAQVAHNLTTPTAALTVAGVIDPSIGDTFDFVVVNSAGGAAVTVVGGAGVTLKGSAVVAIGGSAHFVGRFTNVTPTTEAVALYRAA